MAILSSVNICKRVVFAVGIHNHCLGLNFISSLKQLQGCQVTMKGPSRMFTE